MSTVTIRIPSSLRPYASGQEELCVPGRTIAEALENVRARYGELASRVVSKEGRLQPYVNIFVGEDNVRALGGLQTPVDAGVVLSIVSAVAGG